MAVVAELADPVNGGIYGSDPVYAAIDALFAAIRRHATGGGVARHPEIDRAFGELLRAAGPVSVRQKSLHEIFAKHDEDSACSASSS
jgi:hypothetical protein